MEHFLYKESLIWQMSFDCSAIMGSKVIHTLCPTYTHYADQEVDSSAQAKKNALVLPREI